jgi:hypothetical protein
MVAMNFTKVELLYPKRYKNLRIFNSKNCYSALINVYGVGVQYQGSGSAAFARSGYRVNFQLADSIGFLDLDPDLGL